MAIAKDLKDKKFGRLLVIERDTTRRGVYWRCLCDCGNFHTVSSGALASGNTKGCGCGRTKHNLCMKNKRLYHIWLLMKYRCYNPKTKRYDRYGGRGIKICEEWHNYSNFYHWSLDNGYDNTLSIERKDVNGNYCPENCCWIEFSKQAENRTTARLLTAFGETKNMKAWTLDSRCSVKRGAIEKRINMGWDTESAITCPALINQFSERPCQNKLE